MNLNKFRLSTRLSVGFGVVLLLLALMMLIGILNLRSAATDMRRMMDEPLAKERLVHEWYRLAVVGVKRYTAIAKSTDPVLASYFSDDVKEAGARGAEIAKTLEGMSKTPAEEKALAEIVTARKEFQAKRDLIGEAKKAGNHAEANRLLEQEFLPIAKVYLGKMMDYLKVQQDQLDLMAKTLDSDTTSAQWRIGVLGLLALAMGAACAVVLTRSVTRPLSNASALAAAVGGGDLTQQVVVEGDDEIADVMRSLDVMSSSLQCAVAQVMESSESIQTACREVSMGNQDLSHRTEETASNLQRASSAIAELNGAVSQSAAASREANTLAANAAQVAARGGDVVSQVVQTMQGIHASSRKISEIIGVIDGIAFQTNILALNAAVEAARAGEQGRGFAVVAGEVRSLASRSAEAAKEIKNLISASVEQVESGTELVNQAGVTMDEVVSSIRRVTDIVNEISVSTSEQAHGMSQIATAVSEMDGATQQNAAMVEEMAAAASSLQGQAASLVEAVGVFRLQPA